MRLRLFLAFTLVVVVAVATVLLVARQGTASEVRAFMLRGGMMGLTDLVASLEEYYTETGSWQGIEALFQFGPNPNRPGAQGGQGQGNGRGPGMGEGHGGMMGGVHSGQRLRLADAEGLVIADTAGDPQGSLSASEIEGAIPLRSGARTVGYLVPEGGMVASSRDQELLLGRLNRAALTGALIAGGLALILSLLLAYRLLRPVRELTAAAAQLARGDLSSRVQERGSDEIAVLARAFNHMADSLQEAEESRRAMTADIAHELRTPISVQRANLEALQDGIYPLTPENLEPLLEQNKLLTRLVEDLRTLALVESGQLKLDLAPTNLHLLAARLIENFRSQASQRQIELRLSVPPGATPVVMADPLRLEQILSNLLSNALRYAPPEGWIEIAIVPVLSRVQVTVHDNGPGIPAEALSHIFERFYRSGRSRSRLEGGAGLGLAIARQLAEAQGGSLQAANHPQGGAVFTLTLPLAAQEVP